MADTLVHRGPDSSGTWADDDAGIALGHRRLAIVDLSPGGHQPMVSADGRWVICYNGEVYNFTDLRAELEAQGCVFRGHSDTEVIVESIARHGVDATVDRLIGMFAFALWDRETRSLTLVRDRVGVKPLYWSVQRGVLLFGSELKALRAHPAWAAQLDPEAADALVRFSYIPGETTIYKGVHKLRPGHMLTVRAGEEPRLSCYWSLADVVRARAADRFAGTEAEAVDQLDALLRDAVSRRMVADVPLGAFLSGGIDSSTVVAHMQAASNRPVRTFSIGFNEEGYDEAVHAKAVARHLGTDHTELYLDSAAALDVIPRLPAMFDEPFADSSQLPTYLVAAMTREHVTVALSGDGGDELFGGYPRYFVTDALWRKIGRLPGGLRALGGRGLQCLPPRAWDRILSALPLKGMPARPGEKVHRVARVLGMPGGDALYEHIMTQWTGGRTLVPQARGAVGLGYDGALSDVLPDFVERMQVHDAVTYLPDDIMTKVDRTTMAVSLEAREPLLDHRLVEFAWTLPRHFKIRGGDGKWLLRQALYRYVPRDMVERPKMGFSIPLESWLRGPLREWAEALLDPAALSAEDLFDPAAVRSLWDDHQNGRRNHSTVLWNVLMLQAWRAAA
ncbi:Asparagine synthetase [Caenispirillum salinarum AK4]|uniref:asparagine synthase (glutamine-hydrolyzing) n=2 Tax=Caenispirillum TaxID=414051 RepID=K9H5J2_9PROT|nr:Asparagine synthetase [Caenispirillum salinarum AK4]